jgi:hypothetical protein
MPTASDQASGGGNGRKLGLQGKSLIRRRRLILVLVLTALCLYVYLVWSAPYRTMEAFVRAVERRDAETMVALSHPLEASTHLNPAAVRFALDRIFPVAVLRDGHPVPTAGRPRGWRGAAERTSLYEGTICRWTVKWADGRTGRPLPAQGPGGQLACDVYIKPSARGWRVLVSQFLWEACRSRWDYEQGSQAFAVIGQQAGITGRIDTWGRVRVLNIAQRPP